MWKRISSKWIVLFLSVFSITLTPLGFAAAEEGKISVTLSAGTYEIQNTAAGHELSVDGYGRIGIPGAPSLPAKIFALAIPPGAEVEGVTITHGDAIPLAGTYQVPPASLPRVIGAEDPAVFQSELARYEKTFEAAYGSDNPYPSSPVTVLCDAGYRKYNLVDVRFAPFAYQPQSGKLVYYPNITLEVEYTLPETGAAQSPMDDHLLRTEEIARDIILNYDQAQAWYPQGTASGGRGLHDFVIITLDSLTTAVQPLKDWETAKGRNVEVVTTTWINANYTGYDLAEKMRNLLRDNYPSGEWGIEDVLLVGDYDDVPMRRCWQDLGYGKPETDYYYAELSKPDNQSWDLDQDHKWGENSDPIDFYVEVNVGRIPWSASAIVQKICEKSVAFECNSDPSYKNNILLLGAYFWPDTDNAVLMEYKTDPANNPWMAGWIATRMYEQGHSTFPMDYNLNYGNVKSVWSSGKYAFVNWAGHGSPYSTHIYYSGGGAFVDTGTCPGLNDAYPSIIFADACSNSDTDADNIGQMMLKQGAVGFLGATKVAYGMPGWKYPNHGSSQSMDYYFTTHVTSGDYTQGAAHQKALRTMYTNGLWYKIKYEMFEWGALWGSPTLKLDCEASLWADQYALSVTAGGVVNFTLDAGTDYGGRNYLLLGTLSGTSPGFILPGGENMPINWDAFTTTIVSMLGSPVFSNFLGSLNASGEGAATFDTMGPLPHFMVGLTANFAYLLGPPPGWNFCSNPISVSFEP